MQASGATCIICGHGGPFINQDRGKEGSQCTNCSSSSRNRLVTFALGRILGMNNAPAYLWPEMRHVKILEPCPRGPQVPFFRDKFQYIMPEFDAEKIAGGAPPERFSDIQDLRFEDNTFDITIASDVFEHVRNDTQGFREIFRTLKDGGTFLMTVPYDHDRESNIVRVDTSGESDVHLMPARYHGGGGLTLEYRRYGRELISQLSDSGFSVGHVETDVPQFQIAKSTLLICQKSRFLEIGSLFSGEQTDSGTIKPLGFLLPNRIFLNYKYNLKSFLQFGREAKRKLSS